jgi:hypothetical protein
MGCQSSTLLAANHIDDSIHAMLERDRKIAAKRGEPMPTGYVPRQNHPLLKPVYCSEDDKTVEDSLNMACNEQFDLETEQILYHTKNHTNTVDKRDLEVLHGNFIHINVHQ